MTRVLGLLLVSALLTQGCQNYRLGSGPAPSFATLYVEMAKNKTTLAQSQVLTTTMIREAFIRDGRVEVVGSKSDADATLEVSLDNYRRENAGNREDDNGLARKFTLHLRASCSLRDNRTGRMLFDGRIIEVQRDKAFRGQWPRLGSLRHQQRPAPVRVQHAPAPLRPPRDKGDPCRPRCLVRPPCPR